MKTIDAIDIELLRDTVWGGRWPFGLWITAKLRTAIQRVLNDRNRLIDEVAAARGETAKALEGRQKTIELAKLVNDRNKQLQDKTETQALRIEESDAALDEYARRQTALETMVADLEDKLAACSGEKRGLEQQLDSFNERAAEAKVEAVKHHQQLLEQEKALSHGRYLKLQEIHATLGELF